jgi:hypothetical protein
MIPSRNIVKRILQQARQPRERLTRMGTRGYADLQRLPAVNESTVVTSITGDVVTGGPSGAIVINASLTLDQSCADNATTNINLGSAASYSAFIIAYHAKTTTYVEAGSCVVAMYNGTAIVTAWQRGPLGDGYPLNDDTGLDADVSAGTVRLKVTTKSLGAACDFRATYLRVAT